MTERNIPLFIFGLVIYAMGVVLLWAGLNLPGTTGHDGTWHLTALVSGAGTGAISFAAILLHLAQGGTIRVWVIWMNGFVALISLLLFTAGLTERINISIG